MEYVIFLYTLRGATCMFILVDSFLYVPFVF